MFGAKKGPDKAFIHAEGCRILAADPTVQIEWSELERGHWVAECACTIEHYHEPRTRPARLDPLDPRTAHHLPQCEFASETSDAVLTILLKVTERDGYWWLECGSCEAGRFPSRLPRAWDDDEPREHDEKVTAAQERAQRSVLSDGP